MQLVRKMFGWWGFLPCKIIQGLWKSKWMKTGSGNNYMGTHGSYRLSALSSLSPFWLNCLICQLQWAEACLCG